MPTVSTYLKMFDQFSRPVQKVTNQVNTAILSMERLRRLVEHPSKLNMDASNVQKQIAGINRIVQPANLNIAFNARQAVKRAQMLRDLLQKQFDGIQARIRVNLQRGIGQQQNVGVAQSQVAAKKLVASAQSNITQAINQSTSAQNQFNNAVKKGAQETQKILNTVKGMAATYLSIQAAKELVSATIGGAMEQQKMQDMFKARTGDDQVGAAMFDRFKANALKAGMDVNESLKASLSFFSTTQKVDQLEKLNNLAQRLNAFDSAGNGLDGAAFALKEAMSGDIVSLAERFNMSKSDIRAFKIDDLGKAGDMEGFIKGFDKLLEKQRMGQAAFEKMLASPAKQAEIFKNNAKSAFADAGKGAVSALLPLIVLLNTSFQEGKFQPFFQGLQVGLKVITKLLVGLVKGAMWFSDVVKNYSSIVGPILVGIGTLISVMLIAKLWAAIPPLYAQVAAWLLINGTILLIAAAISIAIVGLIYTLQYFGVTADQMVGAVVGSFMFLYAAIYNQISFLWNIFASFAEYLINLFIDPVYAIQKLFYDLAQTFGGHMVNMARSAEGFAGSFMESILGGINKALEGLNWFTNKVNGIFGTEFDKVELFDAKNVHAVSDRISGMLESLEKPKSNEQVVSISRMGTKNLKNEFDYGYGKGAGLVNQLSSKVSESTDPFDFSAWNKSANIDKVGEVGKIKDKVDISSEDLKIMRELAEMKNIQNFVTLEPSYQFGDTHVRNESDMETLVARLNDRLQQDIASSANAAYG